MEINELAQLIADSNLSTARRSLIDLKKIAKALLQPNNEASTTIDSGSLIIDAVNETLAGVEEAKKESKIGDNMKKVVAKPVKLQAKG